MLTHRAFRLPAQILVCAGLAFLRAQEPHAPIVNQGGKTTPAVDPAADATRKFFNLSSAPDPEAVGRGQKIFVTNCGFCHGTNANGGNSGPDLVRSVLVLHDEGTGREIGPVIRNGRPAQGMPKFAFSDAQIKDLAAFFLSRSQSAVNRMEYKIQNIVTGNAAAGESYFADHCASCHNPKEDLAHIAAKYDPVALQSRFIYPMTHRFAGQPGPPPDPRSVTTATVTLPSGKTSSGTLARIDDFSVTLVDSSGSPRTYSLEGADAVKVEVHDPLKGHEILIKQYTDADMHNILAYLETLK
jgi:mono/diheme cytochrome c family protein